jgi:hypothetical protein
MAKKPLRYAVLEAVAREMRANKEMCYFYEYQSPVATLPTGEVLNLRKEFGDLRTSVQGGPWTNRGILARRRVSPPPVSRWWSNSPP